MKYNQYADGFSPAPTCLKNCLLAFLTGGAICETGHLIRAAVMSAGADAETAGMWTTVALICTAQLITGLGWYNTLGRIGGAGAAVPITGFANSVVSPALEYKKEGIILGTGAKIFSLSGPVLAVGFSVSVAAGILYKLLGLL